MSRCHAQMRAMPRVELIQSFPEQLVEWLVRRISQGYRTMSNNLSAARKAKNDEFYTQLSDIERELSHYSSHFRDRVVYCNCDDPRVSNFFHYFSHNFEHLGLRKLITTCYKNQTPDLFSRHDTERAIMLEYDGFRDGEVVPRVEDIGLTHLDGDGDFRSKECIDILKCVDIVVTNPPFSLFREYVPQLMKYDKKFIVIGPWNAVTYKETFPYIRDNRIWLGYGFAAGNAYFTVRSAGDYANGVYDKETGLVKFRNVTWFTNLDHTKRHENLILFRKYNREDYPEYDNFNAINVDKIADIPNDYDGVMGVPVTFFDKFNPEQFEVLGITNHTNLHGGVVKNGQEHYVPLVDGKKKYIRILIRRK